MVINLNERNFFLFLHILLLILLLLFIIIRKLLLNKFLIYVKNYIIINIKMLDNIKKWRVQWTNKKDI